MLYYLDEHADTVSMRDLAEQVAAWEHGTTVRTLSSDERQRVYISLYQNHLPKLDEHGVIEYDKPRGTVERTERADQFDRYIREVPYSEPTVGQTTETETTETNRERVGPSGLVRTAGLSTVGAGVLIANWFGLVSASVLLALSWAALCVVSLLDTADARPTTTGVRSTTSDE